jgi:hypothetical protein
MKSEASVAITYDPNWLDLWQKRFEKPLEDAETFRLFADSTVAEIGGQPDSVAEVEGQYMGLLRFTPEGWAEVNRIRSGFTQQESENVHMTTMLQKITEAKTFRVEAIPYLGAWAEFDNVRDFRTLADTEFLEW